MPYSSFVFVNALVIMTICSILSVMSSEYDTRVTLLLRLKRAGEENDWEDFYHQYARFIMSVALRSGLSQRDAEDILQETMMEMMRVMARFDYDPAKGTFRGFLRKIVTRKAARYRARQPNHVSLDLLVSKGDALLMELIDEEGLSELFKGIDAVWKAAVLEEAAHRLVADHGVHEENVAVMDALLKGSTVEEIAAQTGKTANAIYQVKHRVQKILRDTVAEIMENSP